MEDWSDIEVNDGGRYLTLTGPAGATRFHAIWLRDNALNPATRDPGNGQRLITLADIPADITLSHASLSDDGLRVRFAGVEAAYDWPLHWLKAHRYDPPAPSQDLPEGAEAWDSSLQDAVPSADLSAMQSDSATLQNWLRALRQYGFAKVSGMTPREGGLFDIVDLFGYVRETNYGRLFEVRTEVNPVNLAYTGLGLQAHTDNPYRDPAPTIQVLACLENSATGGANMVVDGFAAALRLRDEDPSGFALLSRYPMRFDYSGSAGVALSSRRPMIERGPDGTLQAVRFNARSAAPCRDVPFEDMGGWYAAYHRLSQIIDDAAQQVTFKLTPGEAFVVDNTRVLHARQGYSGSGTRWLQGCYADKDGVLSTLASLEAASEATHG